MSVQISFQMEDVSIHLDIPTWEFHHVEPSAAGPAQCGSLAMTFIIFAAII